VVCGTLGISDADFYEAIADFGGAARRLERLFERGNVLAFRDFAHAPSKLKATISAVRGALPGHRIIGVFELHTFSSLNEKFLSQYAGAMEAADDALVFYSHHALALKGLPALSVAEVEKHFAQPGLRAADSKEGLVKKVRQCLQDADGKPVCLLLMSSGTFEGIDWEEALELPRG
jgi:UDP-N-acetylmuramate: L-alanyl-gamma-D-glutamyl-meso-diaminopimelate ligase